MAIVNTIDIKVMGRHIGTFGEYWFKVELLTDKAVEYWGASDIKETMCYDPEHPEDRMFSEAISAMMAKGLVVDFTPLAGVE